MFLTVVDQVVQLDSPFNLGIDFGSFRMAVIFAAFSAARIEIVAMMKALTNEVASVSTHCRSI